MNKHHDEEEASLSVQQAMIRKLSPRHHSGRLKARTLLGVGAGLVLLMSSTMRVECQVANPPAPAPLGILVDVGGYRLHLYCIGNGSPAVMIVGGAFSFDWGLVQPEVAKFTRVCTFDPSGTAWSDAFGVTKSTLSSSAAPLNKGLPNCEDRVEEIHRLITKAPLNGGYVLVGFSVGALWERLYAARYPENIAGMVIVDHAFQGASDAGVIPSPSSHSSDGDYSPPVLVSQAPLIIGFEDNSNFAKLPKRDQELHAWALSRRPIRVNSEMVADCFSQIRIISRGHAYPLGNMDLSVISTPNESPAYVQLQADLLDLSHNTRHVIAWNSTHMVPIDEPEVIVSAIHEAVERIRSRPPD